MTALRSIDIPVMVFWGDEDSVAPMEIAKSLAREVIPPKMFTGRTLKQAGHFLMLERPEEWAKTVIAFVGGK